jgi:hypothetical protein
MQYQVPNAIPGTKCCKIRSLARTNTQKKLFLIFISLISRGLCTGTKGEKVVLFGFSIGTKGEFRIFAPLVPILNPKSTTFLPLVPVQRPQEIEIKKIQKKFFFGYL